MQRRDRKSELGEMGKGEIRKYVMEKVGKGEIRKYETGKIGKVRQENVR